MEYLYISVQLILYIIIYWCSCIQVYLLDTERRIALQGRSVDDLTRSTDAIFSPVEGATQVKPRLLNNKKPLPDIPSKGSKPGGKSQKHHMPSISLGLPEIPPGVQTTRTFTYEKQPQFEFFLGELFFL